MEGPLAETALRTDGGRLRSNSMTEHDAHRRRGRRPAAGIRQLPWRRLVNPYRPIEILSADEVETIHGASLRILSEIGMEVLGDRALDALARAGATVDRATRRVRLDPGQVEELVALGAERPSRCTRGTRSATSCWAARTSCSARSAGRRSSATSIAAGGPATSPTSSDYVRLIGALDVIHQEGGGPLEPTDLPVETRHLDKYRALATTLDKTWHCLGIGRDGRR